jgi:hypothetical protein
VDPEPGKPSPWHRGVVREHQVLICPECYPDAVSNLTRCARCESVRLVKCLGQIECLDCRLIRDAGSASAVPGPRDADSGLAAEVAQALERILGAP